MIRVIHMVDVLDKGSGVMNVLINFQKELKKYNVRFDYIFLKDSDNSYKDEIISIGGNVFKLNTSLLSFLSEKKRLINFVGRTENPVIFHNHVLIYTYLLKLYYNNESTYKVGHAHSSRLSNTKTKEFRNRVLSYRIEKEYDAIYGCSKQAVAAWFPTSYKKGDYKIISNPINLKIINKSILEDKTVVNKKHLTLGTVGRLSAEKNHFFLLQLMKELKNRNVKAKLVIIGDGFEKRRLVDYIIESNLENTVEIIKHVEQNQLFAMMRRFDIFLFPSYFEGLGSALLEAQALGIPSIASNTLPEESDLGLVSYQPLIKEKWIEEIENINRQIKIPGCEIFCKRTLHREKLNKHSIELSSQELFESYEKLIKRNEYDEKIKY